MSLRYSNSVLLRLFVACIKNIKFLAAKLYLHRIGTGNISSRLSTRISVAEEDDVSYLNDRIPDHSAPTYKDAVELSIKIMKILVQTVYAVQLQIHIYLPVSKMAWVFI